MRRLAVIGFALALAAGFSTPPQAANAANGCGIGHHWVPAHWAWWNGHRHWVRGHCS